MADQVTDNTKLEASLNIYPTYSLSATDQRLSINVFINLDRDGTIFTIDVKCGCSYILTKNNLRYSRKSAEVHSEKIFQNTHNIDV